MRLRWFYMLSSLLMPCLVACAPSETQLPYPAWSIGFLAPNNMEVWTEDVTIEDVRGHKFYRYDPGTVSISYTPTNAAWSSIIPTGKGREVRDAVLPQRVYVRWQSLVEPQTYSVTLEIPERARQLMLQQPPRAKQPPGRHYYNDTLTIGLAPGGIVRVWVNGPVSDAQPIMCVKAAVEPKGPDQGEYGGRYVTLPAKSRAYLQNHAIPFGSWGC